MLPNPFPKSTTTLALLLTATLTLSSCKSDLDGKDVAKVQEITTEATPQKKTTATETTDKSKKSGQTLQLDSAASKVQFVGAKVTADHRGTFKSTVGKLQLEGSENVTALELHIDTKSVEIDPPKLGKHLKAADFFNVEKYPQAHFILTKLQPQSGPKSSHEVSGHLELRGIKKSISFPAQIKFDKSKVSAQASFKINRKDFGIVYAGMVDDLIKDEVLLEMSLVFVAP